jgi:competence protein ComEC
LHVAPDVPPAAAIVALGLLAGSAVGVALPDLPYPLLLASLAITGSSAVWAYCRAHSRLLAVGAGLAFFFGGALLAADAWSEASKPPLRLWFDAVSQQRADTTATARRHSEESAVFAVVTGVLRADASSRPNGVSLSLDVRAIDSMGSRTDARGGVLLTVGGILAAGHVNAWRAGRTVRVAALLRRPSRYLNPGVPDEERSLARRGTTLVGSVKSGALVTIVANGRWPEETAADLRAFTRRAMTSAIGRWSPRSAAIVTAILIGDRAGLDDELQRQLQEAGTYHVIAISGGNIAILAGLAIIGFRLAGALGRTAMLTAIAALVSYGYLVGGGASVNRATLMAVVYFAARAIDLRGSPINVLALAAGLLVAADPLAVAEAGFLLTFGATVGILIGVPALPPARLSKPAAVVATMLAASVSAEAMLLPISAAIFARVTLAGLMLNLAAIPLMGMVQVAGIVTVLASMVSADLAAATGWVAHVAAEGLVRSGELVTVLPALTWRVAPPHWAAITAYYIGLTMAWASFRTRSALRVGAAFTVRTRPLQCGALVLWLAAALYIALEPWRPFRSTSQGRLTVTFIDVGQGDAALIRFPGGATMLVDSGGLSSASSFDIGDRVVAPVLRHSAVRRLDVMAITHADLDHAGGAAALVREFRPREIWEGIRVPRLELIRELRIGADRGRAQWTNVQAGDVVTIDGVEIAIRHPRLPDWERQEVRNDDSIVLELTWRDVSFVLTGDIGREVEREIGPQFSVAPLRVIKVPHHGSLTSSSRDFVRSLAPRVAVVSAGRNNSFGHPAAEVLDAYRQVGAQIFRTDQDGAITIGTDGYSLEVRTFGGQRVTVRR